MKPLNRVERSHAFLRFLLLFIITIGLILAVVFFSVQVPWKENERLRQTMARMQNEKDATESFNTTMKEVVDELNQFDGKKEPATVTYQRVQLGLNKMNAQLKSISNGENSVNALIVQSLADLNKAKYSLNSKPD